MIKPTLSLILPCYNEAEHFNQSIRTIISELQKNKIVYEILIIDDKSKDNTVKLIKQFVKDFKQYPIKCFFHNKNIGRGGTVSEGLIKARGDIAGFIDIDCEISPKYIIKFIKAIKQGYDIACADRKYKTEISGLFRALISKIYSFIVKLLLPTPVMDTEAGYKFFKRQKILLLLKDIRNFHWFWDTELMVKVNINRLNIISIPVQFNRKIDKTSTVNIFQDTISYISEVFRLRKELKNDYKNYKEVIDQYWHNKSPAFSNQYNSFFGIPLSWVGLFLQERYKKITSLLANIKGKVFLDVGCGSGVFLQWAVNHKMKAIGIDYSKQMLMTAKQNLKNLNNFKLIQGNATNMSLLNKSVDIILASGLTDYLTKAETQQFFQEIKRILKPNGYVIVTFPKAESPLRFLRLGFGLWLRKNILHLPPMKTAYSKANIIKLFKTANIVPQKWDDVLFTMRIVMGKKYVD